MDQKNEFANPLESSLLQHAGPSHEPSYQPPNRVDLRLAAGASCSYIAPRAAVQPRATTTAMGSAGIRHAKSRSARQRGRLARVAIWLLGIVAAALAGYGFESARSHMNTTQFSVKIRADEPIPKPQAEHILTAELVTAPAPERLAYADLAERRPVTTMYMSQGRSEAATPPAAEAAPALDAAPQHEHTGPLEAIGLNPERESPAPTASVGAGTTTSGQPPKPQHASSNAKASPAKPACSEALKAMQLCSIAAQ